MNPTNQQYNGYGKMSENDISSRLTMLQRERGGNQGQSNNQNFIMGGREGMTFDSTTTNRNNNNIQVGNGLNAQALLYMSADEINYQISKERNNEEPSRNSINNKNNNSDDEETTKINRKEQLLKMVMDLKRDNSNKSKGLSDAVKNALKKNKNMKDTESEESDNVSEEEKPKVNIKKTVKFADKVKTKQIKEDSDLNTEDSEQNEEVKKIEIDISPEENEEPEFYSDYIVEFNNKIYKSLTNLNIIVEELPHFKPFINNVQNKLNIVCNGKTKDIELDEDHYELDEILEGLTNNLEDINVICSLNDDGFVQFKNTKGVELELNGEKESFLCLLGFTEKKYNGSNIYIAENLCPFNLDKLYLYIPNIDKNKPICTIDDSGNVNMLLNPNKIIQKLDCVVIQIKDGESSERNLFHNFCGKPPKLQLRFDEKNISR